MKNKRKVPPRKPKVKRDLGIKADTLGVSQNREIKDASFKLLCKHLDNIVVDLYGYAQEYIKLQERSTIGYQALSSKQYIEQKVSLFDLDVLADTKYPFRNDVSFLLEDKTVIYLFEAQTSYSNEMAFRCLDYYCRLVNNLMVIQRNEYKKQHSHTKGFQWKIPKPEFYVFYTQDMRKKFTHIEDVYLSPEKSEFLSCKVHNIQLSAEIVERLEKQNNIKIEENIKAYCQFIEVYEKHRQEISAEYSTISFETKDDRMVAIAEETAYRTRKELEKNSQIINTRFYKEVFNKNFLGVYREERSHMTIDEMILKTTEVVTAEVTKEVTDKTQRDIAKKSLGILDDDTISQITGLSLEEVKQLRKEIGT